MIFTGDRNSLFTFNIEHGDLPSFIFLVINQAYYIFFFSYKKDGTIGLKLFNLKFKNGLSLTESFIYGIISLFYLLFPILLTLIIFNKKRKLISEMAITETITQHNALPVFNIKLANAFNGLIIFISVFIIAFVKFDIIDLHAKLNTNSRTSGTQLSGFWYSYNEGGCFNNGDVFFIDEKGIHKIRNGEIELFLELEKIERQNNQITFHGKKALDEDEILLTYKDKGFEIFHIESRHKGNVRKAKGSAFFSKTSMRQCAYPTFVGVISGMWNSAFQASEINE